MSAYFTESTYESAVIELFTTMGYTHIYAPDLNRTDYTSPLLDSVLLDSLVRSAAEVFEALRGRNCE